MAVLMIFIELSISLIQSKDISMRHVEEFWERFWPARATQHNKRKQTQSASQNMFSNGHSHHAMLVRPMQVFEAGAALVKPRAVVSESTRAQFTRHSRLVVSDLSTRNLDETTRDNVG
jgi:hypothetical protein